MSRNIFLSFGLIFALLSACGLPQAVLVAGSPDFNQQGFQNGQGVQAKLSVSGIAYAAKSHRGLFIANSGGYDNGTYKGDRIRFMDARGNVSTFAGTGNPRKNRISPGTSQPLESDIYANGVAVDGDTLYFSSPGCIQSIDLSLPQADMRILTLYGTCLTDDDLKKLDSHPEDDDLRKAIDPYDWRYLGRILVDESKNVFLQLGPEVQKISQDGKVEIYKQSFNRLAGVVLGPNKKTYVFYDDVPDDPIGPPISEGDVSEIGEDRSIKYFGRTSRVFNGIAQCKSFYIGFTDQFFYKIDENLKISSIGSIPTLGDPLKYDVITSVACNDSEGTLFLAGTGAVYQYALKEEDKSPQRLRFNSLKEF